MIEKVVIYLCLIAFLYINQFAQNIPFANHTTKDGLSNNKVISILQDKTGFLWFGTEDGLNRFDGYEFKVYRNNPADSNSISGNNIWSLFEDEEGNIWVGTKNGDLNRYDPNKEIFKHWKIRSSAVRENSITAIYKSTKDIIWIGTYQTGLYSFNVKNEELENWNYKSDDQKSISNNFITSIIEDNSGYLWISTYNGLNKFNPGKNHDYFLKFYYEQRNQNSLSSNLIWSITKSEDDSNLFWIGTANGLVSLDIRKSIFTRIPFTTENSSQFGNSVASIVEEKINEQTILWISTYGGLVHLNLENGESFRFSKRKNDPVSLISNEINDVIKDCSGVIWLATENGLGSFSKKAMKFNNFFGQIGIDKFDELQKMNVKSAIQDSDGSLIFGTPNGVYSLINSGKQFKIKNFKSSEKTNVWSLVIGMNNVTWIGTYGQGLEQLNLKNGTIKNLVIESPTFKTSAFDYLKSLFYDENNNLWIGFWGGGLGKLNPATGNYKIWITESGNPKSISHNDVWAIHKDQKGRLWIGTNGGGLNLFEDTAGGKFHRWIDILDKAKQLSSNSIYSICESLNGKNINESGGTVLWVGTSNGLNKILIHNSSDPYNLRLLKIEVKSFSTKDGLSDNSIKSIIEDKNGNLWIGTNSGISFFDAAKSSFINFTNSDGVIGSEFNSGSALYSKEGTMYFGSADGLNVFNPNHIKRSEFTPPIVITDFQIFNQPVKVNGDSPLKESILNTKEIILSYSQNVFSFQFSALDYNSPQSIQYAYMMEGFDKDWIYSGERRFITYTNLDAGTYSFKVKATNSDGIWGENIKSISVTVNQPWWRTGWAYIIYSLLIVVGIFTARKIEVNRTRLRNELKMREFEAKKQKELENLKSRFFANLSHEFRTPLTLIRGPIDELISGNAVDNQGEYFELIKRNSEKLQELIDQLLELTQLENAAIPLKAKQEDLINILRGSLYSFDSLSREEGIKISIKSEFDKLICWIDRDKLEKIVNNLLSNAFKFTSSGGEISINIFRETNKNSDFTVVRISDTGIGIAQDKLQNIFDRFYQVDDSTRKKYGGSGIGLALVKELVDLHKWDIEVKSELGKGTEFYLRIPLSEAYLQEYEKEYEQSSDREKSETFLLSTDNLNQESIEKEIERELAEKQKLIAAKPLILIVEDSDDVRLYLTGLLKNDYKLKEAFDGEDGIRKAAELMPDLIISDVMMPLMDGFEFCRKIKSDWETSHIPVILLTAKASSESKIEGLETGADDYLTKPFSSKELSVRIKNLLEQRKKLHDKFSKEIKVEPASIAINSLDHEFLGKAFAVAQKNLSNAGFSSDMFAKEMFVSRSQLHRKLVSLTGQGPGEFLRTFRLKKSATLILERKLSITQIAFEVGFSSPSHFTKAFRRQFNCLPTEFIQKNNS